MARFKDKGSYFEIKYEGTTLRVNKNTGQVMDTKAGLTKGDVGIIVSALSINSYKELADKVANRYRGKFPD
jgi:hypothetical protein